MAGRTSPANPWLRGVLVAAGGFVVGIGALAGCSGGSTPTVPQAPVSTYTTAPPDTYATSPTPDTTYVVTPLTTTVDIPAPATTEAPVPQQNPGAAAGSGNSGGSCGADSYQNVDGQCVHDPVQAPSAPSGATAKCNDGTYSFSKHHSGTCSGHGGVAAWLT